MRKIFSIFYFLFFISCSLFAQWVQTNGPSGGAVNVLLIKGDTTYAGICNTDYSSYGAIYFSTNNGLNWKNISPHPLFHPLTSLVKNNEALYAGTFVSPNEGNGVYITTNNGLNWTIANTIPSNAYVFSMTVCNGVVIAATDKGIFKTSNNGVSWQTVSGIAYCSGLASNGNNFYAYGGGSGSGCGPLGGMWGAYMSTDYGLSWQLIGFSGKAVIAMGFKSNYMFVSADNGVYRTSNNGVNWVQINDVELTNGVYFFTASGNNLFASTFGDIYLSTDNGDKWRRVITSVYGKKILSLASKDNIVFAGTEYMGVYRSTNNGDSWVTVNNGIASTMVNVLCVRGSRIFAGTTFNGGISSTVNNGNTWRVVNNGIDGIGLCNAVTSKRQYVFAGDAFDIGGNVHQDVLVTSNNGVNWYSPLQIGKQVNALITAGQNVYAGVQSYGYSNLFRSTDNGQNWSYLSGIPLTYSVTALCPSNDSTIFAIAGGIWRTTNNGQNWVLCDSGNTSSYLSSLCCSGRIVFAGARTGEIYMSTDNGDNWITKGNELQGKQVNTLAVMSNYLFSGIWYPGGMYMSTNYGDNWIQFGMDSVSISSLLIYNGYLYAATYGAGVWKYPVSALVSVNNKEQNIPKSFILFQNYPNPFNPVTVIKYSIPVLSSPHALGGDLVILKVYDILGRVIQTLVNEKQSPGTYEATFDGSGIASGIYFYTLIVEDVNISGQVYKETKKSVLLK